MSHADAEGHQVLVNRELVATSKWIAKPFEEAYQWMQELGIRPDSHELVGTIAFTGKGKVRTCHLTWSELVDFHRAYEQLDCIKEPPNAGDGNRRGEAESVDGERG